MFTGDESSQKHPREESTDADKESKAWALTDHTSALLPHAQRLSPYLHLKFTWDTLEKVLPPLRQHLRPIK